MKNHENEMELFLIGKNLTYQMVLNIINSNIKYFNDFNEYNRNLELETPLFLLLRRSKGANPQNDLKPTFYNKFCCGRFGV